nr:hypothetical protein [Gemmatimonadota bacterium]
VQRAFDAIEAMRWRDVAPLLHPDALRRFRLQASDPREAFRRELLKKGAAAPEVPMEELPRDTREIVGSVVENDSTVQVLYRTRTSLDTPSDAEGRMAVATVRRSAQGWGIWLTWQDHRLFDQNSFGFSFADPEENEKRRAEARAKGFAWPAEGTPMVRASVQGDTGGEDPPRTLVIEVRQPDGRMQRVEIPYAALMPLWSYLEPWY